MIASNIRVPGSYNDIDKSGANQGVSTYRQPIVVVAPRIKTPAVWVTGTAYTVGQLVRPTAPNGYYYICITAGTSDTSEPTWPGAGGSVTDGTAVFREFCLAAGIVPVHTPTVCYSADDGAVHAGRGSIAHRMVRRVLRQFRYAEVSLITVDDDNSGVCAAEPITVAGTADGSGSVEIRIGIDPVRVSWADGATNTEIAAAIDAAVAVLHDLPVTPSVAAGVVTLKLKNAGVFGNELGRYNAVTGKYHSQITVKGSGITITSAGFSGGDINPDITAALTSASAGAYAVIACPYRDEDNVDAVKLWLNTVSDEVNCAGARSFFGVSSTIAAATAFAAVNSERINLGFVRKVMFPAWEIAAGFAALIASRPHPAILVNNEVLVDCDSPGVADILEFNEKNALLWAGVTPFNGDGSGVVRCVRAITTYTTSEAGSPDSLFLDTMAIACYDFIRKDNREFDLKNLSNKVLRDNHVDGEPDFIITPDDINSIRYARAKVQEQYGVCQNVDLYKDQFVSLRVSGSGRVNSDIPTEIVEGLHILANTIRVVSQN